MRIVDVGSGPPVVVIPGIQGRWEWMKPAIDALAERCRVITFSLADERGCGAHFDPATGFDCYVEQVREALDARGRRARRDLRRVVRRARLRRRSRRGIRNASAALVLVSALPPSWTARPPRQVLPARAAAARAAVLRRRRCGCTARLRRPPRASWRASGAAVRHGVDGAHAHVLARRGWRGAFTC